MDEQTTSLSREGTHWHSEGKREQAVTAFLATGSLKLASELSNVPYGTIRQWKTQDWWPDLELRIKAEADDELDIKLTRNINKVVEKINDRLENGDIFYNPVTGEVGRKEIGAKDLGILLSIHAEKRDLIRNKKQIRSDTTSINQRLDKIADEVRKLAGGSKVIEGEVLEVVTE